MAFTAINSHVVLPIARECARQNGDLWIVYMGNNEVLGPFGAGSVFSAQSPPLSVIRTSLALKRLKLGQLADRALDQLMDAGSRTQSWAGMDRSGKLGLCGPLRAPVGADRLEQLRAARIHAAPVVGGAIHEPAQPRGASAQAPVLALEKKLTAWADSPWFIETAPSPE